MARGRGRPALGSRKLIATNIQFTPEQMAWLRARVDATNSVTLAAVARQLVQAAMDAERQQQAEAV